MLVVNVINGQRLETRKDLFRNTGVPLEELLGPLRIESGMCFVVFCRNACLQQASVCLCKSFLKQRTPWW